MTSTLLRNRALLANAVDIDWDKPGGRKKAAISDDGTNVFGNGAVSVTVFHKRRDPDTGQKGDSLLLRHQTVMNPSQGKFRDWPGNFGSLAALLWSKELDPQDGPIEIVFNDHLQGPTVKAAGVQIQTLDKGIRNGNREFIAMVRVLGLKDVELGKFSVLCAYSKAGDDSATFVGVNGGGISRIEFSVGDPNTGEFYSNGFAINRLSVVP